MASAELAVHEQITRAFIEADPTALDINRPTPRTSDGAGGKVPGPVTVVAVGRIFRLLPQSRNSSEVTSQSAAGQLDHPRFVILSTNDFRFEKHDWFEWKGFEWKVSSVHMVPEYESKADVVRGRRLDG